MRIPIRLAWLVLHFVVGAGLTVLMLPARQVDRHSNAQQAIIAWWLLKLTKIFGIVIAVEGKPCGGPVLFVSNHVSWLDIGILGGLCRSAFLSKSEVRRWPMIGWLASRAGTLFIERGGKGASERAMEQIVFRMRHGAGVILFPEGTTTDGSRVRKFHPRLFGAAQLTRNAVQPVAIRYAGDGYAPSAAAFIDDQTLVANAWGVLGQKRTYCCVSFLPPIDSTSLDRRTLSEAARRSIVESLGMSVSVDLAL